MEKRLFGVAALVVGSGFCALIYQVAWLRELRLVFGGSTGASAAVLAIFMGGLGAGGAILGKRVDRYGNPLAFYAYLEVIIAATAAISPVLLLFVRDLYIQMGGSMVLGSGQASLARLGLAWLVLGIPTFLMGGTLPAVARAVETGADVGRNRVAILYGANTLGAVGGAFLATFVMLEMFGTRTTLWMACLLNFAVAVCARSMARGALVEPETAGRRVVAEAGDGAPAPRWYVLIAAGVVGFAFLLMELVWYRMMSPLLGGSTYTFGLILAVALLGIGAGSVLYSVRSHRQSPTLEAFALTVGLEALFIALPFAAGDRLAVLALVLRDLASYGFYGHVFGWTVICLIVVLPAALVAGYQFPLLIGLLGRGRSHVGTETGLAYAFNTGGAILGSLAGGFGALPLLGAAMAWKLVIVLLSVLGLTALVLGRERPARVFDPRIAAPLGALAASVVLVIVATGPTAVWRHSGIGAGRASLDLSTRNAAINSMHTTRRQIVWEKDGVESSVALQAVSGLSFIISGKNDGNARFDASTQVMLALISALVHPTAETSFVVGMGTGSTAGWLAAVEGMERVDVAELEPAILEMARRSSAVNYDAMTNPKVNVVIGDARELLLTVPEEYDLIVSEPSNPYRAGIASLYTKEFYEAVAGRLRPGGLFSQWVQAYEIDAQTFRTIYATLSSVFPVVETWQTNDLDLVLICSNDPIVYPGDVLERRIGEEPFRSALLYSWGVTDLEGLFSRYVANHTLARHVADQEGVRLNTDDWNFVEYGFARTVGQHQVFTANELRSAAHEAGAIRPLTLDRELNWPLVEEQRMHMATMMKHLLPDREQYPDGPRQRAEAMAGFIGDDLATVAAQWREQDREASYPLELIMVGEALAELGDGEAVEYIERLRVYSELEADAIAARLALRQGRGGEAVAILESVYAGLRANPWPLPLLMHRTVKLAQEVANHHEEGTARLLAAMSEPFSVGLYEEIRKEMTVDLSSRLGFEVAVAYLEAYEPHVMWTRDFLGYRARCYEEVGHPLAKKAERDFLRFWRYEPTRFRDTLGPLSWDRHTANP